MAFGLFERKDFIKSPEEINKIIPDSHLLDILRNEENKSGTNTDSEKILSELSNKVDNDIDKSNLGYPLLLDNIKWRAGTLPNASTVVTPVRAILKQKRPNYSPNFRENLGRRKWNMIKQNGPLLYDYGRPSWDSPSNGFGREEYQLAENIGADAAYPNYYYYEIPEKLAEQDLGRSYAKRYGHKFTPLKTGIGQRTEYMHLPDYDADVQDRIKDLGPLDRLPHQESLSSGSSRYSGRLDTKKLADYNQNSASAIQQGTNQNSESELQGKAVPFQPPQNSTSRGVYIPYRTQAPDSVAGNSTDVPRRPSLNVRRLQLERHHKRDMRQRQHQQRKITALQKVSQHV